MTDARKFVVNDDSVRQRVIEFAREVPLGWEFIGRPARKTRDQEERYHAMIGDIARQYQHAGRRWDTESMKRLLVDAFKHETRDDPDLAPLWRAMGDLRLVPSIGRDGFVALGDQTRKFPKKLASAFIEWLFAFGAENGVRWTEPQRRAA